MKLQIALDDVTLEEALALVDRVKKYIDIIEIGTPLVYEYGMQAVRIMKERFPDKEVLADMKIMDAGCYEAKQALRAGADYVTVLGVTDNRTIKGCAETAGKYGKEIVVDMICVEQMEDRISVLEELGVHGLAVHTGTDQQAAGRTPLDDLKIMSSCVKNAKISVAGGISAETVDKYAQYKPEVVIVGGGICHAQDPEQAAKSIYQKLRENKDEA
ncbi:MAG: 3-hexulose-6-phosphate synthase [Blautia sp.]|uniref:3-hexulose-6-phosphate synthase n=1 Tax=Blautia sp. TaxID=1955243 RepID=UPI00257FC2C9|nr:3-hexulose-6-phosphate synthase [Blautia sp.]MBS5121625.1 3-hexulose-6-phosphate synthase [Blautia sp.]